MGGRHALCELRQDCYLLAFALILSAVGCSMHRLPDSNPRSMATVPPLRPRVWIPMTPEGLDRRYMKVEAWRTRLGLSECLLEGAEPDTADRVSLVEMEFSVTPWGMVDSVDVAGQRVNEQQCACVEQTVRTWVFTPNGFPKVYRTVMPISAVPARAHILDGMELTSRPYSQITRAIVMQSHKWGRDMADCYADNRFLDPVATDPLRGEIAVVRFTVEPDGSVSGVRVVDSTLNDGGLHGCLTSLASSWSFDGNGSQDTFEFPFTFGGQ